MTDSCLCGHPWSRHETPGTECSVVGCTCSLFGSPESLPEGPARELLVATAPAFELVAERYDPMARGEGEHWPTPGWVLRALLDAYPPPTAWVVEPSAGEGAMVRVLVERGHHVAAVEQNPACLAALEASGARLVDCPADWLVFTEARKLAGCEPFSIVLNPPYRPAHVALAHLLAALTCGAEYVAALLPLSFLSGGSGRRHLWRRHEPTAIHWFSERPKFSGSGGMFEPCWVVWEARSARNALRCMTMLERGTA